MSGAPPPIAGARGSFLPQIESLRGYMALAVAYTHCIIALLYSVVPPVQAGDRFVWNGIVVPLAVLLNGRAAVIVFFVISGLVLSLALDHACERLTARSWCVFAWRRALRIYPAHLAALGLFVPIAYLLIFRVPVIEPERLAANHAMHKAWIDGFVYGRFIPVELVKTGILYDNFYNPVTWTLQVEILGSLFLPLFALLSRPGRLGRDLALLALLILAAALLVDANKRPDLFPSYLPAFYLGCMARTHGRRWCSALGENRRLQLGWLLGVVTLMALPAWFVPIGVHALPAILAMTLGAFGTVTLLAWSRPAGVSGFLLRPASRWIGRLSYSFYLWHDLVLFAYIRLLLALVPPDLLSHSTLAVLCLTLIVTIPLAFVPAYFSWALVEVPFVAFGKRWARRAPTRPAPAEPDSREALQCP
ncbi:MAG: hypothetical protein QOG84_2693 [Sphingomonadales bacterium]|jgi:peptidoglycan/LPS O-acetylase OafA/YrhL|nr:hypothetical protein [Sphingomonadales bacterium]